MRIGELLQRCVALGLLREITSGDARAWTREDWLALPSLVCRDAESIAARILLDCTGGLGRAIASEVLLRRAAEKATRVGSDVFCVYHDTDMKDCPPGEHE